MHPGSRLWNKLKRTVSSFEEKINIQDKSFTTEAKENDFPGHTLLSSTHYTHSVQSHSYIRAHSLRNIIGSLQG